MAQQKFPMADDEVLGDAGNLTVYQRPDASRYALDKRGAGQEFDPTAPIFGRARFDTRDLANGTWEGSRSEAQLPVESELALGSGRQVRRRRSWSPL